MDTWNRQTDLRGEGGGWTGRNMCIAMDTDNYVVKARGQKLGGGGYKWGKWGTSLIVSTLKKKKQDIFFLDNFRSLLQMELTAKKPPL